MSRAGKTNDQFVLDCKTTIFTPLEPYTTGDRKMDFACKLCGSIVRITGYNAIHSKRKRCMGCITKNEIVSMDETTVVIDVSTNKCKNCHMVIDKDSYKKILSDGWGRICAHKSCNVYYAVTTKNKSQEKVHRLVLDTNLNIDHINHNGLDNRKCNLRPCSTSQNLMNGRFGKSNTGHRDIHYNKRSKKYAVRVSANNERIHAGYFNNIKDAINARDFLIKQMHGDFSCG